MSKIEYAIFTKSAIKFKKDLHEILKHIDHLDAEALFAVSAYIELIRKEACDIGEKIKKKVL